MIVIVIAKTPSTANPTAKNSQSSAWGLGSHRGRLARGLARSRGRARANGSARKEATPRKRNADFGPNWPAIHAPAVRAKTEPKLLDRAAQTHPRARAAAVRDRIGEGGEGEAGKGEPP